MVLHRVWSRRHREAFGLPELRGAGLMANDSLDIRKKLRKRGYRVDSPTGRGDAYYKVVDPKSGNQVITFPTHMRPGSLSKNLWAAIRRYERTGEIARNNWST